LGITTDSRIWLGGHNLDARRAVEPFLKGTLRPAKGPIDAAFIVARTDDEEAYFSNKLRPRLAHAGAIWVIARSEPGTEIDPASATAVPLNDRFIARRLP